MIIKQAIFKTSTFLYVNISGKVKNNKIFLCFIVLYKNGRSWLDILFPIFLELTPYTTRKQFFECIRSHFYAVVVGLNIFKSQLLSFYLITFISIAALVTNKWKKWTLHYTNIYTWGQGRYQWQNVFFRRGI